MLCLLETERTASSEAVAVNSFSDGVRDVFVSGSHQLHPLLKARFSLGHILAGMILRASASCKPHGFAFNKGVEDQFDLASHMNISLGMPNLKMRFTRADVAKKRTGEDLDADGSRRGSSSA